MSKVRFELNPAGVRELLKSEEMAKVIGDYTEQVSNRAGSGYGSNVRTGRNRMVGRVYAETEEAYADNLNSDTLLRSISG